MIGEHSDWVRQLIFRRVFVVRLFSSHLLLNLSFFLILSSYISTYVVCVQFLIEIAPKWTIKTHFEHAFCRRYACTAMYSLRFSCIRMLFFSSHNLNEKLSVCSALFCMGYFNDCARLSPTEMNRQIDNTVCTNGIGKRMQQQRSAAKPSLTTTAAQIYLNIILHGRWQVCLWSWQTSCRQAAYMRHNDVN